MCDLTDYLIQESKIEAYQSLTSGNYEGEVHLVQNSGNNNKYHGNPGIIRLLIDTAESIATHSRDIKKNTEAIIQ